MDKLLGKGAGEELRELGGVWWQVYNSSQYYLDIIINTTNMISALSTCQSEASPKNCAILIGLD